MSKKQPEDLARSVEGENDPGFENPMEYLALGAMIGRHKLLLQQAREGYPEGMIKYLEKCKSKESPR